MGASPFGYVEGSQLSQDQLTAILKHTARYVEPAYFCAYCGTNRPKQHPQAQNGRCEKCGAWGLVCN